MPQLGDVGTAALSSRNVAHHPALHFVLRVSFGERLAGSKLYTAQCSSPGQGVEADGCFSSGFQHSNTFDS